MTALGFYSCRTPAEPGSALAKARMAAHAAFDPIWRSGRMSRSEAYRWLAYNIGVPVEYCHMQMLTEEMCAKVVAVCDPIRKEIEAEEWRAFVRG